MLALSQSRRTLQIFIRTLPLVHRTFILTCGPLTIFTDNYCCRLSSVINHSNHGFYRRNKVFRTDSRERIINRPRMFHCATLFRSLNHILSPHASNTPCMCVRWCCSRPNIADIFVNTIARTYMHPHNLYRALDTGENNNKYFILK